MLVNGDCYSIDLRLECPRECLIYYFCSEFVFYNVDTKKKHFLTQFTVQALEMLSDFNKSKADVLAHSLVK